MPESPLATRRVVLRVPSEDDLPALREAEYEHDLVLRWRYRGAVPGADQYREAAWSAGFSQFLACDATSGEILGWLIAYGEDRHFTFAYLAGVKLGRRVANDTRFLEAGVLFIELLFATCPLRKLYMHIPEFNLDQVGAGPGQLFVEEGRLRSHTYLNGRWWDLSIRALHRDAWETTGQRYRRFIHRGAPTLGAQAAR